MALPESFQIALQRAEDERKLERETVLQRIGETVQKGVPLLSGVVAGALSRSPIIGIGASFVADQLQASFERKRQERSAKRMEMRQRDAAAEIAVREGLFQNKKEALQAIEASRLQDELENTRRREESLLNQFNLQRQQEEVQEQQEQIVREQAESSNGEGLALQSTLAHVDSEISGIADLLLDRFADEEDRHERDETRRELEAARLRESLSEASRQQSQQVREVTGENGVPERDRRGLTGTLFRIFGRIPLPFVLAGLGIAIVAGLTLAFKDLLPSKEEVKRKVLGVGDAGTEAEKIQNQEELKAVGDPMALSETAEETDNVQRVRAQQNDPNIVVDEFANVERDVAQPPQGTGPSWLSSLTSLFNPLVEAITNLVNTIGATYSQQRLQQVEQRIEFLNRLPAQPGTPEYNQQVDEMSQLMREQERLKSELNTLSAPTTSSLVPPRPQLGGAVAKVSFEQAGVSNTPVIAPIDASSTSSTTNINNSRTVQAFGSTARNDEGRNKFTYA